MIVHIAIGNSDDKLTQAQWSNYCVSVRFLLSTWGSKFHGEWYSLPNANYQNACFCVEQLSDRSAVELEQGLADRPANELACSSGLDRGLRVAAG